MRVMSLRKLLIAAASLAIAGFVWRRIRRDATVDIAPPENPAATSIDDAVTAAVGAAS
jgi:hypothetical protein